MLIRPETSADRSRVATLIARTYLEFGAQMIEFTGQLRRANSADAELGLVAEMGEQIAAFLLLTPVKVDDATKVAYLSIFAVDSRLDNFDSEEFLNEISAVVHAKDYDYLMLQGQLSEFSGFGFKSCADVGLSIKLPELEDGVTEVPTPTFIAKALRDGAVQGLVNFPEILSNS